MILIIVNPNEKGEYNLNAAFGFSFSFVFAV